MLAVFTVIVSISLTLGLNNGLGRTPQMGYNSWYDVRMSPSETNARDTIDAMLKTGLFAAGYRYYNLDDGIIASRDASGALQPDPKLWPSGFKGFADYVHSRGMLFGLYTDRGPQTCGGRPAAQGYEAQDARTYASWGVDYVKEDSCHATQDHQLAYTQYATMRDALNATGRSIFFSLCGWNNWYAPVGQGLGNSWRTGPDDSNWPGVLTNIDILVNLWQYAGPGGWNDPCLLLGRDMGGTEAVTDLQGRAQFSMWAVLAAPMLLSMNVRNLTAYQLETYLNKEVIAVNQDSLGRAGQKLMGGPLSSGNAAKANVWGRPLQDGSWALVFINADTAQLSLTCDATCLQATGWEASQKLAVRDLWAHKALPDTTVGTGITVSNLAPQGGVAMFTFKPKWT